MTAPALPLRPTSTCRACGAPIAFRQLPSGSWQPLDPETGEVHFATCSARVRPNHPDHVCIKCGSLNVEQTPGVGPHYAGLRCLDCGGYRWLRRPQ